MGTATSRVRVVAAFIRTHIDAVAISVLLLLASVLPATPQAVGAGELLYAAIFAGLMARWALGPIGPRLRDMRPPLLAAGAVLGVFVLTAAWALPSGTSMTAWARGLAPFLNLLVVFPAAVACRSQAARRVIVLALGVGAVAVAIGTYAVLIASLPEIVSHQNLLYVQAYASAHAYSPILVGMAAYAIGAAFSSGGARRYIVLLAVILPAVLLTFLKSLLLIFIALAGYCAVRAWRRSGAAPHPVNITPQRGALIGAGVIGLAALVTVTGVAGMLFRGYILKFATLGAASENTRVAEYAAVLQAWGTSPFVGKGLGFTYSYLRPELGVVWSDTYTHNLLSFALLTAGLLGFAAVAGFLVTVLREAWIAENAHGRVAHAGGAAAILYATLAYSMLQATYRTLSFWLVVAVALGIVVALQGQGRPGRRLHD